MASSLRKRIVKYGSLIGVFALVIVGSLVVGVNNAKANEGFDWNSKYFSQSSNGKVQVKIDPEFVVDYDNDTQSPKPFSITRDGGKSWSDGFVPEGGIWTNWTSVSVSANGHIIVLSSGAGDSEVWGSSGFGYIYVSTNSGKDFTKVESLGAHDWQATAIGPRSEIFVADNGVWTLGGHIFVSKNYGKNWNELTDENTNADVPQCFVGLKIVDENTVAAYEAMDEVWQNFKFANHSTVVSESESGIKFTLADGKKLTVENFTPFSANNDAFDDYIFAGFSDGSLKNLNKVEIFGTYRNHDFSDVIASFGRVEVKHKITVKIHASETEISAQTDIDKTLADNPKIVLQTTTK